MKKKALSWLLSASMTLSVFSGALPVTAADFTDVQEETEETGETGETSVDVQSEDADQAETETEEEEVQVTDSEGADQPDLQADFTDDAADFAGEENASEGPQVKNNKTVYTLYTRKASKGVTSSKRIEIGQMFEGSNLTYEAKYKDGSEAKVWNDEIMQDISTETADVLEYTVIAKDSEGRESVPVSITLKTVDVQVEFESDSLIENYSEYYYLYDENSDNKIQTKISYVVGGEKVDSLPEDLTLTWSGGNGLISADENNVLTISKPAQKTQVSFTYGVKESNLLWYPDTIGFNGRLTIYPENLKVTGKYEVTMPEDGRVLNPISIGFTSNYSASELNIKSSDPDVAEVTANSGWSGDTLRITPKKIGKAVIVASWIRDKSNSATFTVNVKGVSVEAADGSGTKSVVIDPTDENSGKLALAASGTYKKETFTWSSSDENIATVDENGVVTGLKEGSVTIYATSSRSTEEAPLKGGIVLQIKENQKPYLEDMEFNDWNNYEGWQAATDRFHQTIQNYEITVKNTNTASFNFVPHFDDEKYDVVLSSQEYGGEYKDTALENGVKSSNANALEPGHNLIYIKVTDKADTSRVTTYTFDIFRPYTDQNTLTTLVLYPNGSTALKYPTYKNRTEGTMFQVKEDGTIGNAGYSPSVYNYQAYVFGKRTDKITFQTRFATQQEHVYLTKDDGEPQEVTYDWATDEQTLNETGSTVFRFEVMSDKAYAAAKAEAEKNGTEFVFAPEKTYTITVDKVDPLGIDSRMEDAEVTDGMMYAPGFDPAQYSYSVLLDSGKKEATLKFHVQKDIEVYYQTSNFGQGTKLTGEEDPEGPEGTLLYTAILKPKTSPWASDPTIALKTYNDDKTESGFVSYTFSVKERDTKDAMPDSVEGYLCIGSQYTNKGSYGLLPERTLKKNGDTLSLGNFGGYITYKYDTPIQNSSTNPYGIDFIAYGNSNGGQSFAEPGSVQVSKDGQTWYDLAGSVHYDDEADWNYSMTYTRNSDGTSSWTDSDGNSGTHYLYPDAKEYPYYTWNDSNSQSMTVTGLKLINDSRDPYGSKQAAYPDFGYCDVNQNAAAADMGKAGNPYAGHAAVGDGFDLDWAVDADGMPVQLDSISYIRVSTASSIYAGIIGEKSTEVTAVYRTANTAEEAVGRTTAPTSVTVNGQEVSLDAQVTDLTYTGKSLDVKVTAEEGANIYINGQNGAERTYETAPKHGILRVITQTGEKEPDIRYIRLHSQDALDHAAAQSVIEKINAIGKVTLDSQAAIQDARGAYENLTEEQKVLVTNTDVLVKAEKDYAALVKANTKIPATSVKTNIGGKKLYKGQTYQLKAIMAPADTTDKVTWKSSDKKVATVDKNGKVKALKKGKTIITVRTTSGKTFRCGVHVYEVKATQIRVTEKKNITVSKKTIKKGQSYQIKIQLTPKNTTDTLKWKSSNSKVAKVNAKGKVTGLKKGTAVITATTSGGIKTTIKVTVK